MAKEQIKQLDEILHDVARAGCEDKLAAVIAETLGVDATEAQRAAVAGMLAELEALDLDAVDDDELAEVLMSVRAGILEVLGVADEVPADSAA